MAFELTRMVVLFFFVLVSVPILAPAMMLIEALGRYPNLHFLQVVLYVICGVYAIGLCWLAHETSRKLVFYNKPFSRAFKETLVDGRILLSYVPVVGKWFAPRPSEESRDLNRPIE